MMFAIEATIHNPATVAAEPIIWYTIILIATKYIKLPILAIPIDDNNMAGFFRFFKG